MRPNDVPEFLLFFMEEIARDTWLHNYETLKRSMGSTCRITMKAAEIFIDENRESLEQLARILHEQGIGKELHEQPDTEPSGRGSSSGDAGSTGTEG